MSENRYVVRGTGRESGRPHAVERTSIALAIDAATQMDHCTDVRIFAVADDGKEAPLPTYEEAIGRLTAIAEDVESALAWHRQPGGMRPNHPPELAGCPPSALRYLLRAVQR